MGLSNFSSPSEGLLPLLAMNAVMSVNLVKEMLIRPFLQVVGAMAGDQESEDECSGDESVVKMVSVRRYNSRSRNRCGGNKWAVTECCVCLRRFKECERVSELCCNHLFHKCCLDKWFDNNHKTCPLCRRSVIKSTLC